MTSAGIKNRAIIIKSIDYDETIFSIEIIRVVGLCSRTDHDWHDLRS